MKLQEMFGLQGEVAIVTGGNGGIGRAIALGLANAGASVGILARDSDKNAATLAELEQQGAQSVAVQTDVTQEDQVASGIRAVEQALGDVTILVNNAGVVIPTGLVNHSLQDWMTVIQTNLTASFICSKLVADSMIARKRGKIINLGSAFSFFGSPIAPSYSAAKGGVIQLTKSLAVGLARHNIQVNAIAPGWVATAMTAPVKELPIYDDIVGRTPAGRFGEPGDCVGAVLFLASRAADFVNGATIVIDGGFGAFCLSMELTPDPTTYAEAKQQVSASAAASS